MTEISGQNVFITRKYVTEKHGEDALKQVLEKMPPESRKIVEDVIDIHKMYDVAILDDLMKAIAEVLGRDELKPVGIYTFESQVKLLGILMRFYSLDTIIEKFKESYPKIYSEGEPSVTRDERTVIVDLKKISIPETVCVGMQYYLEAILVRVTGKELVSSFVKKKDSQQFKFVFKDKV